MATTEPHADTRPLLHHSTGRDLLGRLAVDANHQGRGLAAALLKHFILKSLEVAELTGVRLLLVHANNDTARRFYLRYGFEPSPVDDLTLMLLVKDVRPSPSA
ncbi:GNAT family N-acetyltransferase [Mycobacterium avium]|uniref:GNAT family N-acetyltransferase n=2 Tax=Mycobacterium avium TaxID=1764 RepID=UPI003C2D56C6